MCPGEQGLIPAETVIVVQAACLKDTRVTRVREVPGPGSLMTGSSPGGSLRRAGPEFRRQCRVARGISAPGPHRSGREVSAHPARAVQLSGRVPQFPVSEQAWRPLPDSFQPCLCPSVTAFESLVLPPRPAQQMTVHALADGDHRAWVQRLNWWWRGGLATWGIECLS
jgi:hypothetical protein